MAESGRVRRSLGRRAARVVIVAAGAMLAVGLVVGGGLTWWGVRHTRASLPLLEGEVHLAGLAGRVTVERDALGVPVIRGGSRQDVARATGFLHAQERFFQMDLMRRRAAGELSELLGPGAVEMDSRVRVHRFRHRAGGFLAAGPAEHRALLAAYTEGVNAGLESLAAPPFEYMFLRSRPRPWEDADSTLVSLAMYLSLQGRDEFMASSLGLLFDSLPPELAEFLAPRGTEWDAPITGEPFVQPRVPGPEVVDLRAVGQVALGNSPGGGQFEHAFPGSNNWAVAGSHSVHGGALVANDMHLGLGVPPTWYRAELAWNEAGSGDEHRVVGVTLPGIPIVVVGSNTRVAWGFTNSYGDWVDMVILETCQEDQDRYLAPEGCLPFIETEELVRVKGGSGKQITVRETIWGPVVDEDHAGRLRVLRWVAHDPEGVNLNLIGMETAASLEEALAVAATVGIAAQNIVLGDDTGRVAWVLGGRIPNRKGCDGRLPASWSDGACAWDGYLPPEQNPRVIDPELGRLWTANSRVVSGEMYRVIGDGGYDLGARAGQIRDRLLELEEAGEADMLALQLDDRALFLERWRALMKEVLDASSEDDAFAQARSVLAAWEGRAAVGSVAYRLVGTWRFKVGELALEPLAGPVREVVEDFSLRRVTQWEGPLWALLQERPMHLLAPEFESWDHLLSEAVAQAVAELTADGAPLAEQTWGRRNTVRVRHPLSSSLGMLSAWLDMPLQELPGDMNLPRVQGVGFGASQRMVVSPGREELGIFHMPAGQSGHPFSPYFREGHQAWVDGEPTPLLPGPPVHTLILLPTE